MTLPELERLCVEPFQPQQTRLRVYQALEQFVQEFLAAQIPCEMLIDGSFLTTKPEPSDVDIAVYLAHDFANKQLLPSQRLLIDSANSDVYIERVDSFVVVDFPLGHEFFRADGDDMTWGEHFGKENHGAWLKGTAVLRLWETDVGLRIRR